MFYNYEVYYNKSIRQSIAYTNSTKIYLNAVEKKFNKFDKVKKKNFDENSYYNKLWWG